MAERSVVVRLRAEVADFKRKMDEAASTSERLAKSASDAVGRNSDSINALSNQAGALGLVLTGVATLAVKSFADFDEAMSAVRASTHETAENMDLLREAALDAGAQTAFSATEAAGAVENLAKAGVSTADILGGGLDGALSLAAAGGMDVAEAAETAASAMTQFGLKGDRASHVADLLAAGAGKAQGEVSDMGAALNQSGLVAAQMGLSIEETVGSLTAFAKAGLIGSDAGTSFRAMLLRLANPTKESAELMDELGINAYNAQGEFVGMESLAGQLQRRLGDLTVEQRNAALAQIFGMDAIRSASILYEQGARGIAEWTDAVDESGYAAETAAMRMDNLKGDVEELGGSIETAFIRAGESADGPLRSLTQNATNVVNALAEMPPAAQSALMGIVGGGGLVLLGVAGLGKLVVGISETKAALSSLGVSAKTAGLAVGGIGAALGVAALGLTVWAQNAAEARARTEELQATFDEFGNITDQTLSRINDSLSRNTNTFADNLFGEDPQSLIDRGEALGLTIEDLQGYILGVGEAQEKVNAAYEDYVGRALEDSAMFGKAERDRLSEIQPLIDGLNSEADALTDAEKAAAQKALADEAAGIAAEESAAAMGEVTTAAEEQTDALLELIQAQADLAGIVLSQREAERQLQQAIDDATAALETNGTTLDITTEKGRQNQAALDDIAQSSWNVIESMRANGATQEQLQAQMATSRQAFIDAAVAAGMTADEANRLADEFGLIPDSVETTVTADTSRALSAIQELWNRYNNRSMQIYLDAVTRGGVGSGPAPLKQATGGYISGPGTSTSDSIPAWLSNGEYVIKADSVGHYGKAFFDALNAQKFATGGYVGPAASGSMATRGAERVINVNVNNVHPVNEPASVTTNSALQLAASLGSL